MAAVPAGMRMLKDTRETMRSFLHEAHRLLILLGVGGSGLVMNEKRNHETRTVVDRMAAPFRALAAATKSEFWR
jgi:hypothetical protein